ncbi:MAG: RNA methyltransferase [Oscillospiraceae bacterium]|nr:RNA methyltransferase [Oscillospiraceae bacterium]
MERITSRDNRIVKLACALGKECSVRREEGLFLAEGAKLCMEAADCGVDIRCLLVTGRAAQRYEEAVERLAQRAESAFEIAEELQKKISGQQAPQGVFCLCRLPEKAHGPDFSAGGKYLALDEVQDPGNLGTIVRTADAFGLSGLILGPGCADLYSPKVLRSTMGSAFRLPVWTPQDLEAALEAAREAGLAVYGAALRREAARLSETAFPKSCVVVVGNEGNGISPPVLSHCDKTVFIDMKGGAESLNAGVAAAVLMWELSRG